MYWVNRCQMTHRLTDHSKVSQWSKIKLFGLQIGRYTQHASIKVKMNYLCHMVISIVDISVINHFHSTGTSVFACWCYTSVAVNQSPGQIVCSMSLMASLCSTKHPPDVGKSGTVEQFTGQSQNRSHGLCGGEMSTNEFAPPCPL